MKSQDRYIVVASKKQAAKGGSARAKNLTPKQLSAIGRLGAKARWKKRKKS